MISAAAWSPFLTLMTCLGLQLGSSNALVVPFYSTEALTDYYRARCIGPCGYIYCPEKFQEAGRIKDEVQCEIWKEEVGDVWPDNAIPDYNTFVKLVGLTPAVFLVKPSKNYEIPEKCWVTDSDQLRRLGCKGDCIKTYGTLPERPGGKWAPLWLRNLSYDVFFKTYDANLGRVSDEYRKILSSPSPYHIGPCKG